VPWRMRYVPPRDRHDRRPAVDAVSPVGRRGRHRIALADGLTIAFGPPALPAYARAGRVATHSRCGHGPPRWFTQQIRA